jgi:TrmH family RNA methyltransferase
MTDFPAITSPRNEKIKAAVKLRRRKHRGRQGRTLIDGARELSRAISAGVNITEIYFCPTFCHTSESRRLLEQVDEFAMDVYEVTENVFEHLAFGERAEGFVGVAIPPESELDDLLLPENPLVVVVEGIEKPGNLGAIIRSADGAGVSAVILADQKTDIFNPNTIRASLGTVFTMPVCASPSKEVFNWLKVKGFQIAAATVDAPDSYTDVDFKIPTALILGTESTGLSAAWKEVYPVSIPMRGVADSLNVSTSAAVLFYEAQRQRLRTGNPTHFVG